MPEDIDVGEVGDDEVTGGVPEPLDGCVSDAGDVHLGHRIELLHVAGRLHGHALFAREGILALPVQEVIDMDGLLGLHHLREPLAASADDLTERVLELPERRESDLGGEGRAVLDHRGERDRKTPVPVEVGEVWVGERLGELHLALAANVVEDDIVRSLDAPHRGAVGVGEDDGLHGFVFLTGGIGCEHGLGQGVLRIIGHGWALPPGASKHREPNLYCKPMAEARGLLSVIYVMGQASRLTPPWVHSPVRRDA